MQAKADGHNLSKVSNLINENSKIKGKLEEYHKVSQTAFKAVEDELARLKSLFQSGK